MTPGIPGTGIGGLFYMLSAAALPLREGYRRLWSGVAAARWRVIAMQQLLAAGILGGMWTTGWLLGVLLSSARTHLVAGPVPASHNVWRTATFALSFATLIMVVCTVELMGFLARLRARRRERLASTQPTPIARAPRRIAAGGSRGRWLFLLLVAELVSAADPPRTVSQAQSATGRALARAESIYNTGDPEAAIDAYAAVLAIDPKNSRATYRLADLQRHKPARALPLFRRYVALEPKDLWGYLAVADMLSRLGRSDEALRWSDSALRLDPTERDAVLGKARVLARARRTDAALVAYRAWLATHPGDAEVWQELSRELVRAGRPGESVAALERSQALAPDPKVGRRLAVVRGLAAPAFTPLVAGSHDSDGNTIWRFGGALELGAAGPARFGIEGSRSHVGDGVSGADLDALALRTTWQPLAALRVDATGGGTRIEPLRAVAGSSAALEATGLIRARWRAPASRLGLDLRADRGVVDASPLLVANHVMRTQYSALLSARLAGPFTLRGIGKRATLSDSFEVNHKTMLSGVLAVAVKPSLELSAQLHQIHYDRASASGFFAPWGVQVVEAGTYFEIETPGSVVLAVDAGAGVQRVAQQLASQSPGGQPPGGGGGGPPPFGQPPTGMQAHTYGPWTAAFRLYALLDVPLAPGRAFRLELDSEDSQVATTAATSGQWRYGSVIASLRWAFP
ncbi:MAG TPA: tetratricopeptide repeat protein [Gemmatimonadales bacterium]|nr:tetratricopeptide repeat protein [Gemmatimonadales bacterium]